MIDSFIEIRDLFNKIKDYNNEEDIYRELKYTFSKAEQLINQKNINEAEVLALCKQLQSIDNATVQTFVKMYLMLHGYDTEDSIIERDSFYYVAEDNTINESIDLLWKYRELYSKEDIARIWKQYLSNLRRGAFLPDPFRSHNNAPFDKSREDFFIDIIKDNDDILSYYFKFDLYCNSGIICKWIQEGDWSRFVKYISLTVTNNKGNKFNSTYVYKAIKRYMSDYIYRMETPDNIIFSTTITQQNIKQFQNALASISQIARETSLHSTITEFLLDTNAPSEIIRIIDYDETQESTEPMKELHDYINRFIDAKKYKHDNHNHEYIQILKKLYNVKLDWEIDYLIDDGCELNYTMALDEEISSFYFLYCLDAVSLKKMLIVTCIMNENITRGIELVNLLLTNVNNPQKDKYLQWTREAKMVISNIIRYFDPDSHGYKIRNIIVNENQIDILEQIINYAISSLPQLETTIETELNRLHEYLRPESKEEKYQKEILSDVEKIIEYSEEQQDYEKYDISTIAMKLMRTIKELYEQQRIDLICKIMTIFEENKYILAPLKYSTWMNVVSDYVLGESYYELYQMNPVIFEGYVSLESTNQYEIRKLEQNLVPFFSKQELVDFKEMINKYHGSI